MDKFRQQMQQIADSQASSPKSLVISQEKYEAIRNYLLDKSQKVEPNFKYWVKMRKFQIVDFPGLGIQQALVIPNDQLNQVDGISKFLRVVHARNVFDVVKGVHAKLKHSGYKKVMDYVHHHFFGITRRFVQEYCKHCPVCQLSHPQVTRPPLQPVIQNDFFERVQVDLIDMRHSPDRDFTYIGHFMDHFSKFHVLFPLKGNTAEEVAMMLEERVLAYFGPPKILHSDNGREFVNQLIIATIKRWGGDTTFINGRPLHSQSLGVVEEGNNMVEKKIAAMKQDNDSTRYPWASWLPCIMFSMNSVHHGTIRDTPYHVVFGRSVPASIFLGATKNCVDEESLGDVNVKDEPLESEEKFENWRMEVPEEGQVTPDPAPHRTYRVRPTRVPHLLKKMPPSDCEEEENVQEIASASSSDDVLRVLVKTLSEQNDKTPLQPSDDNGQV